MPLGPRPEKIMVGKQPPKVPVAPIKSPILEGGEI
jgi:hypothetical protein